MKDLIEYIVKQIVDYPEQVKVTQVDGERTTILELRVAKEDLGKVIGRQGRIARAMRTILSVAGVKEGRKYQLEIIEN